jgi:hypothetical protein
MIRNYKDQSIYKNLLKNINGMRNKLLSLLHNFGTIKYFDFYI